VEGLKVISEVNLDKNEKTFTYVFQSFWGENLLQPAASSGGSCYASGICKRLYRWAFWQRLLAGVFSWHARLLALAAKSLMNTGLADG